MTSATMCFALALCAAARVAAGAARAGDADAPPSAPATSVQQVVVVARTPLGGPDEATGAIQRLSDADIARARSQNLTDVLLQRIPSVSVTSETGNDFEPDVQFRGFVATPLSGEPEGLAVYQNGVRVNEAFGDNVHWDFIPTLAIESLDLITDNPLFGLNALGGAIDVRTRSGFTWRGLQTDVQGGAFGRVQTSTQWGAQDGDLAAYLAIEAAHDDGWRPFTPSTVRRVFADIGYQTARSEVHLNVTAADNLFGAAGTTPIQLLEQNYGAVFTTPQTDHDEMAMVSLQASARPTDAVSLAGVLYARVFDQHHVDGNGTDAQPCDADPALLCFGDGVSSANGLDGRQLANPFGPNDTPGEIDTNSALTHGFGGALQAETTSRLFGLANDFVVGASLDVARTDFDAAAELGLIEPDFVVRGIGVFLGASGDPISDGPVKLVADNTYVGLYALDTLALTPSLTVTAGGRFNRARIDLDDQLGGALSGRNIHARFNPAIGISWNITPGLTLWAGYSQANRAPTPLELGCANPLQPCIIDSFLVSDPPLKQVVARTVEAGLRGELAIARQAARLRWRVGLYRTDNTDDILNIPSPLNNGFGYFANVGGTRRQGAEASVDLKAARWSVYAAWSYLDATWRSALTLAAPDGDPFADANGDITVTPGDRIASIPRQRLKLGCDFDLTDKWILGADMRAVGSQYYGGDESNQNPPLPGYGVFGLHTSYKLTRQLEVYGLIDNLFDRRYYTFATFFENSSYVGNSAFPNLTDTRSLSPGKPFAAYVGAKVDF